MELGIAQVQEAEFGPFGSLMGKVSPRAESGLVRERYSGVCAHSFSLRPAGHCSAHSQTVP